MDPLNAQERPEGTEESPNQKSSECSETRLPSVTVSPTSLQLNGILFQINRQILHPLGMEIRINDGKIEEMLPPDVLVVTSHNELEDTERAGLVFTKEELATGREAFNNYMRTSGLGIVKNRVSKYAYVVQEEKNDGEEVRKL